MIITDLPIGRSKNRIKALGVELEGGWITKPPHKMHADGSVYVTWADLPPGMEKPPDVHNDYGDLISPRILAGEVAMPPMMPSEAWEQFMHDNYPPLVNKSCGMHLHMSFKYGRHYTLLMHKDFQDTLIHHLTQWANEHLPMGHDFFRRLRGENSFCKLEHKPDQQAVAQSKNSSDRYSAVNYPYALHGTIEVRVLGMMPTVELATDVIQTTMNITNAYLAKMRGLLRAPAETSWTLRRTSIKEVFTSCV